MRSSQAPPATVEEYLRRVPEPARTTLNKVRTAIRAAVPAEATEVISYGMPGFYFKGPLVWYAAFAKHCSFFPGGIAQSPEFAEDLKGYVLSKGTIRFPVDKPLPAALIKKLVKVRLAQNAVKAANKKARAR